MEQRYVCLPGYSIAPKPLLRRFVWVWGGEKVFFLCSLIYSTRLEMETENGYAA